MTRDISLQLYTVREELTKDFEGTLTRVAQMGYQGIETYQNYFGNLESAAFSELLKKLGLRISGSHANKKLLTEMCDEIIKYNHDIGNRHLICSFAEYENEEEFHRAAEFFNTIGKKCQALGMMFSYHNHAQEFKEFSGKYGMDILLEETDPAFMGLELDVYWATKAGADPILFQRKWKDRSLLLHCKDMADDEEQSFAAVGEGILDFKAIIPEASKAEWLVVEQDRCDDSMRCAKASYQNLRKLADELYGGENL